MCKRTNINADPDRTLKIQLDKKKLYFSFHLLFSFTVYLSQFSLNFLFFSSLFYLLTQSLSSARLHLILSLICCDFSLFSLLQMAEWPLFFISFTFSPFLPSTLFTSNHNKYKPLTLTLLGPKYLFLQLSLAERPCLFLLSFLQRVQHTWAHFSLIEVRLLTSHRVTCSLNELLKKHLGWTMVQCTQHLLHLSFNW